jgi:predicted transcriptional regulator
MTQLNETELVIMKHLWNLGKGFMKDIVNQYPEPKPAYTTISTMVSRMCAKNYIGFTKLGRDKQYHPILKKEDYFSSHVNGMVKNFFNNSAAQFASFFTKETELSDSELSELRNLIDQQIKNKGGKK